jgi:hypothetical protein
MAGVIIIQAKIQYFDMTKRRASVEVEVEEQLRGTREWQ